MINLAPIRDRFVLLSPHLDERERRLLAATEARAVGYGGIAAVARATGIAVSTIGRGLRELRGTTDAAEATRVRRHGGGRKTLIAASPSLLGDLLALVEPTDRGDPMSPLRWTCKGTRRLAKELTAMGHKISRTVVGELLNAQKFSLQGLLRISTWPFGHRRSPDSASAVLALRLGARYRRQGLLRQHRLEFATQGGSVSHGLSLGNSLH